MKKFLLITLGILLLIIVALYIWAGQLVKLGTEKFLPPIVGVPVKVNSVSLSLFEGEFKINGLTIANPKGYGNSPAFSVKKVRVELDMQSLFSDTIVIKELEIERPKASLLLSEQGLNLNVIQNNVQSYLNKGKEPKKDAQKKKTVSAKKAEKNLIIRKLRFNNGEIIIGAFGAQTTIPLPNIEQKNIGEKSKQSFGQTIAQVFSIFSAKALQEYASSGVKAGKALIDKTGSFLKNAWDSVIP